MDTVTAARRWADTLRRCWPSSDPEPFLDLYADGSVYRTVPGETEEDGREHMRRSLALGEPNPDVWVGEPVVAGDRAVVEWWAVITIEGADRSFAGSAWVRFDEAGLIVEEHDYWRQVEGRVEPWPGWGAGA
jgi:hypothetical protein